MWSKRLVSQFWPLPKPGAKQRYAYLDHILTGIDRQAWRILSKRASTAPRSPVTVPQTHTSPTTIQTIMGPTLTEEGLSFLINAADVSPSEFIDQFADLEGAAHGDPSAGELQYSYYAAYFLALFLDDELLVYLQHSDEPWLTSQI